MADEEKKTTIPTLEDAHYFMFNKAFNRETTGEAIAFILRRNLMERRPATLKLIINSPGGSVSCAFALIDMMKCSEIPIQTYGLGEISSCGLLTFMAGTKGKRYITNNTSILSHQYSAWNIGKEHELLAYVKEMNNVSDKIIRHYKKCTKLSEKDIRKYLLPPEDVWLTADEAIKHGIADKIIDSL